MSRFYMPTKVYAGPDAVTAHAAELAALGTRALIVTGRNSAAACGALADVTGALSSGGIAWEVFNGVEENPSVETVVKAAEAGRGFSADFVVGIGGGSPMDAAKAVAFLMKRGAINAADLYDKSLPAEALPVAEVPTTCGTGSEVTGVSVLTVHGKRTKSSIPHRIFPEVSFVDGKYLRTASRRMLVNTAVDALAHLVESYESAKADDFSRGAVMSGLALWKESKDILAGERAPEDADFHRMMAASSLAGIAIAQTGTSIPHALSYTLTYDLGLPHGASCGLFLGNFLKAAPAEDQAELNAAAGFSGTEEFSRFIGDVLPETKVPGEVLLRAVETVAANEERLKGCRFRVDREVLSGIAHI